MTHFFYKGLKNVIIEQGTIDDKFQQVKKELAKVLETKNLSFLIGSGCSSGKGGIPTMQKLAEMFYGPTESPITSMSDSAKEHILNDECKGILNTLKIDYAKTPFSDNLETFLGTLYSLEFYYNKISDNVNHTAVLKVIRQTKEFILHQCLNQDNKESDIEILNTYKSFYRKLSLRDSNLPKPNIFTTNYDLYSEKSMDQLGITYTNGFSGFIERYFNPSIFNYALAEQMDISSFKWNIIDSFIYLFKIHGSVNWIEVEESSKLFNIKELQEFSFDSLKGQSNIMIYPSPIKQNASLGTPYSDLFREFQRRIAQNQSVLVTMGYGFNDEHINNLIYQALTIPTFRLVVFSDLGETRDSHHTIVKTNINRLRELNDPRIWLIGSDVEYEANKEINCEEKFHYFRTISNHFLPDWSENQIEDKNERIIDLMKSALTINKTMDND